MVEMESGHLVEMESRWLSCSLDTWLRVFLFYEMVADSCTTCQVYCCFRREFFCCMRW